MSKLSAYDFSNLPPEIKLIICDNCTESDHCDYAYKKIFKKHKCYEVFNEIKEELFDENYID